MAPAAPAAPGTVLPVELLAFLENGGVDMDRLPPIEA
jgi:hypothetical protein